MKTTFNLRSWMVGFLVHPLRLRYPPGTAGADLRALQRIAFVHLHDPRKDAMTCLRSHPHEPEETCDGSVREVPAAYRREKCREEGADEKFSKAERAPYTEGMLFSDSHDRYFEDPAEAREFAEDEGVTLESMRLYLCTPNMARHLDDDFFCDELPEDGEVPDELRIAVDAFNAAVKAYGHPLSWSPSRIALDTTTV